MSDIAIVFFLGMLAGQLVAFAVVAARGCYRGNE